MASIKFFGGYSEIFEQISDISISSLCLLEFISVSAIFSAKDENLFINDLAAVHTIITDCKKEVLGVILHKNETDSFLE